MADNEEGRKVRRPYCIRVRTPKGNVALACTREEWSEAHQGAADEAIAAIVKLIVRRAPSDRATANRQEG